MMTQDKDAKTAFSKIGDDDIQQLRRRIGQPISRVTPPFYRELNVDAARHFAWAIGDDNPLWMQPAYGARTRWKAHLDGRRRVLAAPASAGSAAQSGR